MGIVFWALVGAALGTLVLVGALWVWDYSEKLRERKVKGKLSIDRILDSFSEKQLEDYIVEHFDTLFPVVELEIGKTSDAVVAQITRYIKWVKEKLAQPGQRVSGRIIAKSVDSRLYDALPPRSEIQVWTYDWQLKFNKRHRRGPDHRDAASQRNAPGQARRHPDEGW